MRGVGGAWGCVERAGGGRSAAVIAVTAADGYDGAGSSHTVVAARPCLRQRRRRRLPAAFSVTAGAGMLHATVRAWHPAPWLIFTLAFRPLATQC
jgi:hypothetical protein